MGDRCYMQVTCRKSRVKIFQDLGFSEKGEEEGLVTLIDEEANYAHDGQMPTNVPYYGFHCSGGDYGGNKFACDGEAYVEVPFDEPSGRLVVGVDDRGRVNREDLTRARKYLALRKKLRKTLPPKKHERVADVMMEE